MYSNAAFDLELEQLQAELVAIAVIQSMTSHFPGLPSQEAAVALH
ncbi:hypothetical protein GYH30_011691 [Glycine max]|nr:hypothetical protein GYH30_011691 [Glycine max]